MSIWRLPGGEKEKIVWKENTRGNKKLPSQALIVSQPDKCGKAQYCLT